MTIRRLVLLVVVAAVAFGAWTWWSEDASPCDPDTPGYTGCRTGPVTRVVDGDTIWVGEAKIRFLGMDTPEIGVCGYEPATERVRELVAEREVQLVHTEKNTTDRYGRELAYVEVDGTDVGRLLIEEGLARARYDSSDGYPYHPRENEYRRLDANTPDRC